MEIILGSTRTKRRSTAQSRFHAIFRVPIKILRAGYSNGKAIFVAVPQSVLPLEGKSKSIYYKELRHLRRSMGLCLRCGNSVGSTTNCNYCKKSYDQSTNRL